MQSGFYLLKSGLRDCSPTEKRVAVFLLENPESIVGLNVSSLAEKAGVSVAAVIRLCKRLHLSGFSELKLMLVGDLYRGREGVSEHVSFEFTQDASIPEITKRLVLSHRQNLENFDKTLNRSRLERAVEYIRDSQVIYIVGLGASGLAAADFSQKLVRLGKPSYYTPDAQFQITSACTMTKADVLFALSYSGETTDVITAAKEAKKNGAPVVCITSIRANSLSKISDLTLSVPDTEPFARHGATLSRINQLMVVDALYAALITRDLDASMEKLERTREASGYGFSKTY